MWKNIEESDGPLVNIILRMSIACCITKATNTDSQYVLLFHYKNGCMNAPHCYVVRILPALLHFFPLSPSSRGELTSPHRLNTSGFGAADDRVSVPDVILCILTLRYFPAHTSRSVAGCARCVCQQQAEYAQCLVYTIFREFIVISPTVQIIHLNNLIQRLANLQLL